ncbi:hypothetical protein DJ94_5041 [Bacillus pseudomycoides]|nr:hypothetical protein DJ94_5041 [Bacillus pseudomycoides]
MKYGIYLFGECVKEKDHIFSLKRKSKRKGTE